METQYYYLPVVPCYGGAYPVVSLKGAMEGDRLIPDGKLGQLSNFMSRYAAKGGVVKDGQERGGILVQQRDGTFVLTTSPQAQRKIEHAVTGLLALELDESGTVKDCYLADRPQAYERMAKIAEARFQKRQQTERKPMTASEQLSSALQKVYANPGLLRKDIATTQMPQSHHGVEVEINPPAKTPSRTATAPKGTIDVSELARANDKIRIIGEHLHAAMRENPGSVPIGDAGQSWYAITTIGLGIDSRYMNGAQTVAVTPNNEALAEAWAKVSDKAAGELSFRKALTAARAQPNLITKSNGQVSLRPMFSKSASEGGADDATSILHSNALRTAAAHLKVLDDKLAIAIRAHGGNAHLTEAVGALRAAQEHLENCMETDSN